MAKKTKISLGYKESIEQIEQIIQRIEKNELNIDELSEQMVQANLLIDHCKDKLFKTETEIKQIMDNITE